ncbi:SigB/SigF/SigG family RNA polymerase sigma factor [Streptomyces sp. RB6PN25]|uniref:SigB/SigF/SigG family RNA polymerase sigma factor n=1 Tax=Streptomyces humicola TaxID=2953240 RepID=A0ABT1Q4S0_9ACTN|nr:SigB/SigF/SigG family RNA polymerase sigma factor [Streptomyces humicola]MCQ4083752.1 SigB/SigF/SigG family RNA polymerase sigma factor [Streptomyces humicola]
MAHLPDGPERDALRAEIVAAWTPLSERLAGRFRNRGEAIEDLKQVAALGLVKAVDRYDPDRGTPFIGFAVPTILGEIKRHFRDNLWDLHVPRHMQELRNRVYAARRDLLTGMDERGPTVRDIAAHAELTEDEVRLGMEAINSYSAQSLDEPLRHFDAYSLLDSLGTADPALDTVTDREAVKPCLHRLPPRQQKILYLRFFRDMTQVQIAQELGISQMHVSRIISRTCAQLRQEALK